MSLYPPDPWRALQLPRDASLEEVKAAYRRLAKRYHPDSAGESALPRFLAIQAAYESLTEGPYRLRLGTGRPASGSGRAANGSGPRPTNGSGPRPRRSGPTPGAAEDRPREGTAGPKTRRGSPGGSRASTAGTSERGYSARRPGQASDRGTTGTSRSGRPRRRAKPGSTSYDEAASDPFQPDWNGGSWYGESSGTYWTINPKEYADPRKHGPEYQARARRAAADRYSMPGDRPDPETEDRRSAQPSTDEPREPHDGGSSRPRDRGFSGAAVDWSSAYEDTDDVAFDADPRWATERHATDDADGLWSSPVGLVGLALVALVAVTIAMLAFDGAVGSARPSIVWVGSAALLVILLVRVVAAARRGSH